MSMLHISVLAKVYYLSLKSPFPSLTGNIVDPGTTVLPVNKAGFALNTALHSTGANCVYHTHSDAGTAVSTRITPGSHHDHTRITP